MTEIVLRDVRKSYGDVEVIHGVDLRHLLHVIAGRPQVHVRGVVGVGHLVRRV